MHLTNYSVNRKNSNAFEANADASKDDEGSKWSLAALYRHLAQSGVDVGKLKAQVPHAPPPLLFLCPTGGPTPLPSSCPADPRHPNLALT